MLDEETTLRPQPAASWITQPLTELNAALVLGRLLPSKRIPAFWLFSYPILKNSTLVKEVIPWYVLWVPSALKMVVSIVKN